MLGVHPGVLPRWLAGGPRVCVVGKHWKRCRCRQLSAKATLRGRVWRVRGPGRKPGVSSCTREDASLCVSLRADIALHISLHPLNPRPWR